MDTQKRIHSSMDTEIHAIIYTQKHGHSITDTEIHTVMDSCKNTHRHTQKCPYKKKYTDTYTNPHVQNPHKKGLNTHIHAIQHPTLGLYLSFHFCFSKASLDTHTEPGLALQPRSPSTAAPSPKAVHISLSPSIFIFLLHKTQLAGQDWKHTFLFLEPQELRGMRGTQDDRGDEGHCGGHQLSPPAIELAQDNTPCYKVTPLTHSFQVKTLPYK